jgi:hypothetical protein
MDEFACLTVCSDVGETESSFRSRLTAFWTHMVRNQPDLYEKVYSECTEFENDKDRITRRYMVQPDSLSELERQLQERNLDYLPVDPEDLYSRAEASSSPEWFQIDHG